MVKIVSKFGGSSILQFDRVKSIIEADADRRFIVVSAPGDKDKKYRVTQMLIRLGQETMGGRVREKEFNALKDKILAKYVSIFGSECEGIVGEELGRRVDIFGHIGNDAFMANMKAFGEDMTAQLAARALDFQYVNLKDIMLVNGPYDAAQVHPISYSRMKINLSEGRFVIPGFFGYSREGEVKTFAFGGSDKTGAEIAKGVGADLYENFTDGPIRAADPKYVPDAKRVTELTLNELRDLSYAGFGIYHSEAISPLLEDRIKVHVRSTTNFPEDGTMVYSERVADATRPVVGVAYREGLCAVTLAGVGLNDLHGVLAATTGVLAKHKIAIEFPAVGIDDVSYIVQQNGLTSSVLAELKSDLIDATNKGNFSFYENLACVVLAGKGIARDPLVNARAEVALDAAGVFVLASSMGFERRCILYAVHGEDGPKAVKTLYDMFIA